MELDDLKSTWNKQSSDADQQLLTIQIIDKMTQKKYKSKINKIVYPEIIGSLVCLMAAVFIAINFYKLNTTFLQGVGVLAILLLLIVSINSFLSLKQLTLAGNANKPYAEALKTFALQKLRFYKLQKINITLSYLLLVTIVILLSKFFSGKDITDSKYFWTFSITIGYLFLLFFSTFVTKFYRNTISQTEKFLQELQS